MEEIRLNKYLSNAGVCSRREADRCIEEGRVSVNGAIAKVGMKITGEEIIMVDGIPIKEESEFILLAVNKPMGIICTSSREQGPNIIDMVNFPKRIYPVGRLDKDSQGLVLMTNQGDLVNRILRGSNGNEKEYQVRIDKPVTGEFIEAMSSGVRIMDTVTKPCKVEKLNGYSFRIILTQGLNRQIRRMCEALGCRVKYLKRIRVMNITLDGLPTGAYRRIEGTVLSEFLQLLESSSGLPYRDIPKDTFPSGY